MRAENGRRAPRVEITERPVEPARLLDRLGTTSDGAALLFLGRVRDRNQGKEVAELEYEAYSEMAAEELERIVREAEQRYEIGQIRAVHRVGRLALGEISVAVAVAAPHRDAGYRASRYVIEQLKERLPVWKRERYADGTVSWVGDPAARPKE